MQLILFIGIQASGKSSFYFQRFSHSHIRLSLDMLRTRYRERILLQACLDAKQPVVIDNTNPTRVERAVYIEQAKPVGFSVIGYYFRSAVQDALRRNESRSSTQRIPVKGIAATYKKLEIPRYDEGFDQLWYATLNEATGTFQIEEWQDEL